ncbi:unnamed protein product [Pleuronectes platessa]|uniref:Uncharacterized protein n=1 Tax=Pleuronectes platessa TaxID=8262 RepID=A0A9N7Z279_PLEPL|nr:unnamed protein product [Pleuronectes platessa]
MTGAVIVSSADTSEQEVRKRKKKRRREMEEEAQEKDLYSGAQTRPDQAHLAFISLLPFLSFLHFFSLPPHSIRTQTEYPLRRFSSATPISFTPISEYHPQAD